MKAELLIEDYKSLDSEEQKIFDKKCLEFKEYKSNEIKIETQKNIELYEKLKSKYEDLIFNIGSNDNLSKSFVIRPLPKIMNGKIVEIFYNYYRINPFDYSHIDNNLLFAFVNDELRILNLSEIFASFLSFGEELKDSTKNKKYSNEYLKLKNKLKKLHIEYDLKNNPLINLKNDKALKIEICNEKFNNKYNILVDDKYCYDNTDEKRNFILNYFNDKDLSLEEAFTYLKMKYKNLFNIEIYNYEK